MAAGVAAGNPDVPLDITTLSRDPKVGAHYDSDPLVWHGPFKRPTLQAISAGLTAIDDGPSLGALPLMWAHGEADQLVPLPGSHGGIARLRGEHFVERIYPEARHEIFNEINKDEVLADVTAFISEALARHPLDPEVRSPPPARYCPPAS
jgi:alpha-beta hydrolase superfamily lysophospholipase